MADPALETGTQPMIKYNADGLVPAIVQDHDTGEVLMMAWMNDAALQHTIEHKKATFYSRSRQKMWVKGESSGHVQVVKDVRVDCDQDTVLLTVESHGPACHVGYKTCFYRAFDQPDTLKTVEEKVYNPDDVYK